MSEKTEVPEGYKRTELGIIPEEWDVVKLIDIASKEKNSFKRGPFGGSLKKEIFVSDGYKVYEQKNAIYNDFKIGKYFITYDKYEEMKDFSIKKNDLIISCSGTLGKVAIVPDSFKNGIINQALLKITVDNNKHSVIFIKYLLESDYVQNKLVDTSIGSAMKNMASMKIIKNTNVCIPPLPQQQKIASILSKVDEQIEQTERIIEKTEFLKKGLMQKLLTKGIGHTKFKKSEFGEMPDEWEIVKQSEVVSFYNGRAYKLSEWEKKGTPVIRLQNLTGTGSEYYYSNLKLPSKQYVNKGDLLYMWSGSFGPYIWNGPKAIYHYHIWKIECSGRIDKLFMYYLLNMTTELMKNKMHGMAILHITKSGMENQKIPLPPLPEQQKIASILSKVDSQLLDNHNYLSKLEEIKKGLMQDLLTGKVRVCV